LKKRLALLMLSLLLTGCLPTAQSAPPPPAPTETLIPPTPTPGIGDAITRETDGAVMLYIPAAIFEMGIEGGGKGNPVHLVSLDGYWIDRSEVTNRAFASFLNNFQHLTPTSASQWFNPWAENSRVVYVDGQWQAVENYEEYPITTVNWLGAEAYCRWAGARLPTEAEWELAARSPQGFPFPTGQELTCEQSNICSTEPVPVGSFPQDSSIYGVLDLSGNVMEWVADWFYPYYFESEVTANPKGPLYGTHKILRGGFYLSPFAAYDRLDSSPSFSDPGTGLRCAKSSTEENVAAPAQFYPIESCAQAQTDFTWMECVLGLSLREDGTVQLVFEWDVATEECITIDTSAVISQMYLVDDLGNRIDPADFLNYGGDNCIRRSIAHFIFPKLDDHARWIVFYDDNLGISTNPIPLSWVNPVVSETQPTFIPTPRPIVERFQQVNTMVLDQSILNLSWSADGRSLLVKKSGGEMTIIDAGSGSAWPPFSAGGMQVNPTEGAWSPDGSRLAVAEGTGIYMFDASAVGFFYSLTLPAPVRQLVWSPDGGDLASVLEDGTLRLFNVSAAQMTRTINQYSAISFASWSPDGEKLAVQAADGFHLVRAADAQPLADLDSLNAPAWSPDSTLIAGYSPQQILLQNAVTGERFGAAAPDFSTSGSALIAWAPGGEYFVSANQTAITFWSYTNQLKQIGSLSAHTGQVTSLDFSPDGSYLASGGEDGMLIIWSIGVE